MVFRDDKIRRQAIFHLVTNANSIGRGMRPTPYCSMNRLDRDLSEMEARRPVPV